MNKLTKNLLSKSLILGLLFSSIAQAQIESDISENEFSCDTFEIQTEVKTYVKFRPSYFTKAVPIPHKDKVTHFKGLMEPNEDFATYIADTGGDNNRIVSLNTPDNDTREISVPGPYDPVPTPDGRILSVAAPMRLYDFREFLVEGHSPVPLSIDIIKGVYQSLAWLRGDVLENALEKLYKDQTCAEGKDCLIKLTNGKINFVKQRIYRIIADDSAKIPMIDFLVNYKENCDVAKTVKANPNDHCIELIELTPDGQSPGQWSQKCEETNLQTLFISRQGNYISGFDSNSDYGTSKIYDISDVEKCSLAMDLGYPTGKVDFNDNEDKIIFHLDYLSSHAGGYFSRVDELRSKDVFIMDIVKDGDIFKSKNIARYSTTVTRGTGCYYPSFFNDQIFTEKGHNVERFLCMYDEGEDVEGSYSFRSVDITNFQTNINVTIPPREESNADFDKVGLHVGATIGMIWGKLCNAEDNDEISAIESASMFLNIDYIDCHKIARLWHKNKTLRKEIYNDVRFEDDPRFGDPEYIEQNIHYKTLSKSCEVAKSFQDETKKQKQGVITKVFGDPNGGTFTRLTGKEIAKRKCTGCHHKGIELNAVLPEDIAAGNRTFPNVLEFGHSEDGNPLMFIDASIERIGYNPLVYMKEDEKIKKWLGDRIMPPVGRVELRVVDDYDERKVLAKYLYKLRAQKVKEIELEMGGN